MSLTPRNYQQKAIDFGIEHNLLLSDQMGLGKSLVALEVAKAVFSKSNAPTLIICPKGIRLQWKEFALKQDAAACVALAVDDPFWLRNTAPKVDYLIIHYEAVLKHRDILAKQTFSTIIVDEAHRIKNRKALRSTAIKSLKSFRKIALTGTPFDRNPAEIWSILHWLDRKEFSSYWRFFEQHIIFDVDYLGYKKNFRLKNPQTFAEVLKPYMLRRTKAQVMPELPPLQITHIPIELGFTQRRAYDAIKNVKDLEVSFEELTEPMFIQHALTKIVRLLQCASDPHGLDLVRVPSAKLDWLQDWIADNPHESVLIFSRYRKTAERVAKAIGADVLIMGGSSIRELPRPLVECNRIVATIAAAHLGYDWGHLSTAIYIDCEWSSILMSQSQERIDRGNNTTAKSVIILEAVNTVDELVRQALEQKLNVKQMIDQFLQNMEETHAIPSFIR